MGILLFLFAALRSPEVGSDILHDDSGESGYWVDFDRDAGMSFTDIFAVRAGRDPFFHCFVKALSYITDSPQIMLVVIGAIFAFGFSYFIYHSKGNVLLSFMMLIGFRVFSFSLSGLRQAVSLGLVYMAYIFLRDRRYFKFMFFTALASLFHSSALIFIIAWPLMLVNFFYTLVGLLLVILFNIASNGEIIGHLGSVFYSGRFNSYLARSRGMSFEVGATFIIYVFLFLLILIFSKSIRRQNALFYKELGVLSFGIFFSIVGQSMDNVFRIAYYFIFLLFPMSSLLIRSLVNSKRTYAMMCTLLSILLASQYIVLGPGAGTDYYEFFWNSLYG